jgi:membrane protein required for colicin V production
MEIISLVGVMLGIFLGFKVMGEGMIFLEEKFNVDRTTLPYISFIVIFLLVVFGVRLLGALVKNSVDKTFLGSADQALGGALGVFRTLFMVSIVLWILDSLKLSPREEWVKGSWLYPFTANLAPAIAGWAGQFVPFFRGIFREF